MHSLDVIHESLRGRTCGGCCTRIEGLGVSFGGLAVLRDVSLHVHCGELTAIIGPNGSGKTTLFRALLNEVPHSGRLRFEHLDGAPAPAPPRIGYVPQKINLDRSAPVRVADVFAAAVRRRPLWLGGVPAAVRKEALGLLGLVGGADLLDARLGALSCGQVQRVLLALALQPLPDLLLLDEPVAGVDPSGMDLFYRLLSDLRRRFDLSILVISHDLAAVAHVADRMVLLNRTVVADGAPRAVLAHPEVRRAFGLDLAARLAAATEARPC